MENLQHLCEAIIVQAAKDFRAATRHLKKYPDDKQAQANTLSLECFFRSDWFSMLSMTDGEHILKRLRREVIS